MYRLSLIISEIYNKYLPLAEKDGIVLNLDFSDTTKEIADPERVKKFLDEHLGSTLKRSDKGEVTIGVDKNAITVTDSATTLSHAACALLSNRYIDVTSRVGFGTTVKIFFKPRELAPTTPNPSQPEKITVDGMSADISVENSPKQPTLETAAKIAATKGTRKVGIGAKLKLTGKDKTKKTATSKITTKPKSKLQAIRTKRQLAAAAKKADKEVKRIAKKASKQGQKPTKRPQARAKAKTTKSSAVKTTTRKIKKLELS